MSSPIEKLAPELLQNIILHVHPASHLSLALSCKQIHRNSHRVLDQHRKAHEKNISASDGHPDLIPKLLMLLDVGFGLEAIKAYHLHELEFWGTRDTWRNGESWYISQQGTLQSKKRKRGSDIESHLLARIDENDFKELLGPRSEGVENWKEGCDGLLKLLLIARLPHLRVIRYARRYEDTHSSLKFLGRAISNSLENGVWPPGLQSLRKVYVGMEVAQNEQNEFFTTGSGRIIDFAKLMRLPNIEELYFRDMMDEESGNDMEEYEDCDADANWPTDIPSNEIGIRGRKLAERLLRPGCSKVKTLTLDQCLFLTPKFMQRILNAPSQLETLLIRGDDIDGFTFDDEEFLMTELIHGQGQSLQKLLFYNPSRIIPRINYVEVAPFLRSFSSLRVVQLCIDDLECLMANPKYPAEAFIEIFPPSLEILVIYASIREFEEIDTIDNNRIYHLAKVLAVVISSGRLPNLKVIYVEDMEAYATDRPMPENVFKKAITAGLKHGVHVHSVLNDGRTHHHHEFIPIPDKHDFRSSPFGPRDGSLVVDVVLGTWQRPFCGSCSFCQRCVLSYEPLVWERETENIQRRRSTSPGDSAARRDSAGTGSSASPESVTSPESTAGPSDYPGLSSVGGD